MGTLIVTVGIAVLVAAIVGAVVVLLGIAIYNRLLGKKVSSENAWAQIDVQLKRRHDLIPNLVETVKGYATHEREALERVIQARSSAVSSQEAHNVRDQAKAENMLTGALRQLFAVVEAYPDLKANENFKALHEELTSTENRIGFARQHYNDTAADYNLAIQQVPANIVASIGGFSKRDFFEMGEEEAKAAAVAPKVSF